MRIWRLGWRGPVLMCGALAAIAAILVVVFLRGHPSELGVERYGQETATTTPEIATDQNALTRTMTVLLDCVRSPRFWLSAGWFSDRLEPRSLLALFFLSRGVTLAVLPRIFGSQMDPGLITFAIGFGILDVATVPPTIALCRHYFGVDSSLAFGWVNVFHQIGAGAMALTGGLIRDANGTHALVWIVGRSYASLRPHWA